MPDPTPEQLAAVEAFGSGEHLVLQAGAGSGKTTTLEMLSASTDRRGRYIAFNKSIAQDAARRFPSTVECRTAHSLAYRAVGFRFRERMNAPRRPAWRMGADLGLTKSVRIGGKDVGNKALSYAMLRTVIRFCQSADSEIKRFHVPRMRGVEAEELHAQLVEVVLPFARKAWADLQHEDGGAVRFEHDHYLKVWALSRPRLDGAFHLLDEAQDTNPVVEQVFLDQREHAQLVMVGDSAQAIYGWRGARDVMSDFDGRQLALSQSFRFGPALATEANRWLSIVEAPIRLKGTPEITTELGRTPNPAAILCRTNVGAMVEILALLSREKKVALVGGGGPLKALALAAQDLKNGRRTTHPELILFSTWGELQEYAERDPAGADLAPLVDLVDTHGVKVILDAVDQLHDEVDADIVVSTAHKAKGREWASVRIADDFEDVEPHPDKEHLDAHGNPLPGPIDPAEARLAYVAVTRARQRLDIGGLAWINDHPDGTPGTRTAATTAGRRHTHPLPGMVCPPPDATGVTIRPVSIPATPPPPPAPPTIPPRPRHAPAAAAARNSAVTPANGDDLRRRGRCFKCRAKNGEPCTGNPPGGVHIVRLKTNRIPLEDVPGYLDAFRQAKAEGHRGL